MDRKTFKNVVIRAVEWDCIGEPKMTAPTFLTPQELDLFYNLIDLFNDDVAMNVLSQVAWLKSVDKKSEEFVQ